MRIKIKEELLKYKGSKVMNKFLTKFLTRKPIVSVIWKELLLSSLPIEEEVSEESGVSEYVIKYISTLVSYAELNERRNLAILMHSYQISSRIYTRECKYIIESIDDCCKSSRIKKMRILRDLFSSNEKHRKLSTHVLKKSWDKYEVEDVLNESFDIETCSQDALIELNVFSKGVKGYSSFDFDGIYSIFNSKSEVSIKKSALEQLSLLINDRSDNSTVSGRRLFREKAKNKDVFSIALKEILSLHKQSEEKGVNSLHPNEINYIQELCRFISLSLLFYFDEAVVIEFLTPYIELEDVEENEDTEEILFSIITALTSFLGCKKVQVCKNSLRCLQIILLKDHVKTCIDSSGLPYFFCPSYISKSYVYLFPTKEFKYSVISKINLLTYEEKQLVKLQSESKKNAKLLKEIKANASLFDQIWELSEIQTFQFFEEEFKEMMSNLSEKSSYGATSKMLELIPSDLSSSSCLQSLKVLLKDLKQKIKSWESLSKGLKSFYLLIVTKMREINLPYHFLYSQIIENGIENKTTCVLGPLKLSEQAVKYTESLKWMAEIIILVIETEKIMIDKFDFSMRAAEDLIRFDTSDTKCFIDDLINLSYFLKEKGVAFKVIILKLISQYVKQCKMDSKLVNKEQIKKLSTFVIDMVSSTSFGHDFYSNHSVLLGLKILSEMVDFHSFEIYKIKKTDDEDDNKDSKNTFNWLTRLTEHRDSRIRFMSWNLISNFVCYDIANHHPSLIEASLNSFLNGTELYSVKMSSLSFITKVCEFSMQNEAYLGQTEEDQKNEQLEEPTVGVTFVIKFINNTKFLQKIESLFYQDNIPPLFLSTLLRLLKCLISDFNNVLNLFTSLDIWNTLSQFLKPSVMFKKYKSDGRAILYKGKNKRLSKNTEEDALHLNAFAIDSISILSFILESIKKDSDIAGLLVRSVPFMDCLMEWIDYTMKNSPQEKDTLIFTALTLVHYLIVYNEKESFISLCRLFKQTSVLLNSEILGYEKLENKESYHHFWQLLIDILDSSSRIEIHYLAMRLASTLIACFEKYLDSKNGLCSQNSTEDLETYGEVLWIKFCIMFKNVYFPK
jgi:hypothetical protein